MDSIRLIHWVEGMGEGGELFNAFRLTTKENPILRASNYYSTRLCLSSHRAPALGPLIITDSI